MVILFDLIAIISLDDLMEKNSCFPQIQFLFVHNSSACFDTKIIFNQIKF